MRLPEGFLISRNIMVFPKKQRPVNPDRFKVVEGGIDVGFSLNEATDHTQAFSLTTGKFVGVSFFMRPAKKNYLIAIAGLLICIGWLFYARDVLK